MQLAGYGAVIAVGYGAIRADLKRAMQDAEHAHRRLDDHINYHLHGAADERRNP